MVKAQTDTYLWVWWVQRYMHHFGYIQVLPNGKYRSKITLNYKRQPATWHSTIKVNGIVSEKLLLLMVGGNIGLTKDGASPQSPFSSLLRDCLPWPVHLWDGWVATVYYWGRVQCSEGGRGAFMVIPCAMGGGGAVQCTSLWGVVVQCCAPPSEPRALIRESPQGWGCTPWVWWHTCSPPLIDSTASSFSAPSSRKSGSTTATGRSLTGWKGLPADTLDVNYLVNLYLFSQ